MAKFDFNSSRYAKFFSDKSNQRFLQTFLDESDIFFTNYGWYLTQGRKAANATPTNADGIATFSVKVRPLQAAPMADLRAPLGESNQMDDKGLAFYTGTIPDFIAPGYVEQAAERDYKARQYEIFGNDADIVAAWANNVQMQKDSLDATMNNLTAQVMTTGKMDYTGFGRGIQAALHKAPIPTENFVKAGAKVWTDTSATILTQMKEIEIDYREARGGYGGPLVWQMTRKFFHDVFLKNDEVKEFVKNFRTLNYIASTDAMPISEEQFRKAFADFEGVSPIEIVTERERNLTHTGDSFVQGWKDNIVVLRPAGDAVEFEYTSILDQRMFSQYGASGVTTVFGTFNNGLQLLMNRTIDNGSLKEWHTDVMMSACPALINFTNHLIVDTSQTD